MTQSQNVNRDSDSESCFVIESGACAEKECRSAAPSYDSDDECLILETRDSKPKRKRRPTKGDSIGTPLQRERSVFEQVSRELGLPLAQQVVNQPPTADKPVIQHPIPQELRPPQVKTSRSSSISDLQAFDNYLGDLQTSRLHVGNLQIPDNHMGNLQTNKLDVENPQTNKLDVENLQTNKIDVENPQTNKLHVENLKALDNHVSLGAIVRDESFVGIPAKEKEGHGEYKYTIKFKHGSFERDFKMNDDDPVETLYQELFGSDTERRLLYEDTKLSRFLLAGECGFFVGVNYIYLPEGEAMGVVKTVVVRFSENTAEDVKVEISSEETAADLVKRICSGGRKAVVFNGRVLGDEQVVGTAVESGDVLDIIDLELLK